LIKSRESGIFAFKAEEGERGTCVPRGGIRKVRIAVWKSIAFPAIRKSGGNFAETKLLSWARAKFLWNLCVRSVVEPAGETASRGREFRLAAASLKLMTESHFL